MGPSGPTVSENSSLGTGIPASVVVGLRPLSVIRRLRRGVGASLRILTWCTVQFLASAMGQTNCGGWQPSGRPALSFLLDRTISKGRWRHIPVVVENRLAGPQRPPMAAAAGANFLKRLYKYADPVIPQRPTKISFGPITAITRILVGSTSITSSSTPVNL